MDLSPPTMERFTLRFRDPAWEAAFWADAAPDRARQAFRNAIPLLVLVYPGFLIFFATRQSWPADARLGSVVTTGAGLLLYVAWAIWARTAHFVRHIDVAYGASIVMIGTLWIAILPMTPTAFGASYGLALTTLTLVRFMMISNFPLLWLMAICAGQVAAYLAVVPASFDFDSGTTWGHAATLAVALFMGFQRMRDNHLVVRREYVFRRLSERLVEATLPPSIAQRLKTGERTIADRHPAVSVLFADLVGFTTLTQRLDPARLAALLDTIFSRFDELATREGVEKIKTIGDCYMVAAGLPEACPDHAIRAARMALSLRDIVADVSRESGHELQVRIGIDTGPAVAGVLGRNKLVYDLWGDVVNTAARMESHGEPGAIQITDQFRRALGDNATVRDRGTVEVKGKGRMQTWWLDAAPGASSEASAKPAGADAED